MVKYREKPAEVDAVKNSGGDESWPELYKLIASPDANMKKYNLCPDGRLQLETSECETTANPGDWIILSREGELSVCKPDIFEATYEPIKE